MKQTFIVLSILMVMLAACSGAATASEKDEIRAAPDFTLPNALGGEVSLNDFSGQPVFLFFHMAVG